MSFCGQMFFRSRLSILFAGTIGLGCLYGLQNAGVISGLLQLHGAPVAASSSILSEHDLEAINAMAPQDQAIRLLECTVNHYQGGGCGNYKRADGWIGQVHADPKLRSLSETAYYSNDLRVRAAALEIRRVEAGYRKTPETMDQLIDAARVEPARLYFLLSHLAILGNRGVEPSKGFDTLMQYARDPDGKACAAAINGLRLLGTENMIAPLLEIFHGDTSADCASGPHAISPIRACSPVSCA